MEVHCVISLVDVIKFSDTQCSSVLLISCLHLMISDLDLE